MEQGGCDALQQRSQSVLQGARELGWLIRAVLNQHEGAGPFHTQVDPSLGRGVPPGRVSKQLPSAKGRFLQKGLSCEPETGNISGAGARSALVPKVGRLGSRSLHLRIQHTLTVHLLCAGPRAPSPTSPLFNPLPADAPSSAFLPISLSDPHSLPGAKAARIGWLFNCFALLRDIDWR